MDISNGDLLTAVTTSLSPLLPKPSRTYCDPGFRKTRQNEGVLGVPGNWAQLSKDPSALLGHRGALIDGRKLSERRCTSSH